MTRTNRGDSPAEAPTSPPSDTTKRDPCLDDSRGHINVVLPTVYLRPPRRRNRGLHRADHVFEPISRLISCDRVAPRWHAAVRQGRVAPGGRVLPSTWCHR